MSRPSTALQIAYGVTAVAALIATWSNNIMFMMKNPDAGLTGFIAGSVANHAAASLTLDLVLLGVAVVIWMIVEAKRLKIRWIGAYIFFSLVIAISVAVPIFMIVRERKLASIQSDT